MDLLLCEKAWKPVFWRRAPIPCQELPCPFSEEKTEKAARRRAAPRRSPAQRAPFGNNLTTILLFYFALFSLFLVSPFSDETNNKNAGTLGNQGVPALVEEDGFEPSKAKPADLQSVPFGHLGTPPYELVKVKLELVDGFEPPTC